jgi:hypothetical protein
MVDVRFPKFNSLNDSTRLTRTNPKILYGQTKPPAHRADEVPRHYFRPERTKDRRGWLGWELSIGHSL